MTDTSPLEDAREQAWLAYNAFQQALPECEHVRAWRQQVESLRKAHLAAIRKCDRAAAADEPEPRPLAVVQPEPAPAPAAAPAACQDALFEMGEVA